METGEPVKNKSNLYVVYHKSMKTLLQSSVNKSLTAKKLSIFFVSIQSIMGHDGRSIPGHFQCVTIADNFQT